MLGPCGPIPSSSALVPKKHLEESLHYALKSAIESRKR